MQQGHKDSSWLDGILLARPLGENIQNFLRTSEKSSLYKWPRKLDYRSCRGFKLWVTWQHQLRTRRTQNNHLNSENDKHMAGLPGQHIQHSVRSLTVQPFYLTSFPLGWGWSPSAGHQPLEQPCGCLQAHWPGRQGCWHEKWWPGDASNSKYAE